MKSKQNLTVPLAIFSLAIILFSLVANTTGLNDVGDYLGTAKGLSDNLVSKMRSTHSWIWGLTLSIPLKLFPSIITAKLFNVVWLILIALMLNYMTKSKKVFLLYVFSPVVWYMSPWISPVLPSAFFMLLSYYFIKKYEIVKNNASLIISAAFLSLTTILWDSMLFVAAFFMLCFFYRKTFKEFLIFFVAFAAIFSVRFVVDWYLFSFPLFSLFRSMGSIALAGLKMGAYTSISYSVWYYVLMFISASPLMAWFFYKFSRENYKDCAPEIVFVALTMLFFLSNPQIRYLLILAPILFVLVAPYVSKKELRIHMILSVVLTFILVTALFGQSMHIINYFGPTEESLIEKDIAQIAKDFPNETFLAGGESNSDLYMVLSTAYWGKDIKEIVSWQDYSLWENNQTDFQRYRLESKNNVNEIRSMWIEFGLSRTDNSTFENINYFIDDKNETVLEDFDLIKTYSKLSVFRRS